MSGAGRHNPAEVASAIELACRLEVSAPKPGNVSPGRAFGNMRYEDFIASAEAIAPVLGDADQRPLGLTIRAAIEATWRRTAVNTNLGIVLLLAPLARAALREAPPLRDGVRRVLADSTVADAIEVYRAIRLAAPSGMGTAAEQDLAEEPSITLLETMKLAAGRDAVAAEYGSGYQTTFEVSVPTLWQARQDGLQWPDAVVELFLTLLAGRPDTLIARKAGAAAAAEVSSQAAVVVAAGGVRTPAGRKAIAAFDASLSEPHNSRNPGTTADLIAAGLLALLLQGGTH